MILVALVFVAVLLHLLQNLLVWIPTILALLATLQILLDLIGVNPKELIFGAERGRPAPRSEIRMEIDYDPLGLLKKAKMQFIGAEAIPHYVDGLSALVTRPEPEVIVETAKLLEDRKYVEAGSRIAETKLPMNAEPRQAVRVLSQAHLVAGDAAFSQGTFAEAEKHYASCHELAVMIDDDLLTMLSNYGIAISKGSQGRNVEALRLFGQILKRHPDFLLGWYGKGLALLQLDRNKSALAAFDRLTRVNPNDAEAWRAKGIALGRLGRDEASLAAFDQSIKLNPKNAEAWRDKATALFHLGRDDKQYLAACEESIRLNPNYPDGWLGKATALSSLGKNEDALAACEEAIRVDPKYATSWAIKAAILGLTGRYEEMSVAGRRALELDPTNEYAKILGEVIQEWIKYSSNPSEWRPPKQG